MTHRLVRALPWVVGMALIVVIARIVPFRDVVATLRGLRGWQLAALAAANALVLLAISGRWWTLMRGQGYSIPFLPLMGYRLAAFGLSYFTPGPQVGGEPLQVFLVEQQQGIPRSAVLATVALDKAIEFSTNFAFLLLGLGAVLRWRIVPEEAGRQALGLVAALLFVPLLYLGATAAGYHPIAQLAQWMARGRWLRRWSRRLSSAAVTLKMSEEHVSRFYRRAPAAFASALVISLIGWLAMMAEFWLMVSFLGLRLTLPQLVLVMTAARVAYLMMLPAGLGALELSQALAYNTLGLDPVVGLSASLLIRARDTLLGAFGLWWGVKLASSRGRAGKQPE